MQTRTHRNTFVATTAAATLTLSATAALSPTREVKAQTSAPANVITDAGTIRVVTRNARSPHRPGITRANN